MKGVPGPCSPVHRCAYLVAPLGASFLAHTHMEERAGVEPARPRLHRPGSHTDRHHQSTMEWRGNSSLSFRYEGMKHHRNHFTTPGPRCQGAVLTAGLWPSARAMVFPRGLPEVPLWFGAVCKTYLGAPLGVPSARASAFLQPAGLVRFLARPIDSGGSHRRDG